MLSKKQDKVLSVLQSLCLIVVLFLSLFVVLIYTGKITYSPTPSIQYGFFLLTDSQVKEGDFVVFPNPRPDLVDSQKLLKQVDCISGDNVNVKGNTRAQIKAITGVEGLESFDSKYFGPVKLSDCKKAIPLTVINSIFSFFGLF